MIPQIITETFGRTYYLRAESAYDADNWVASILDAQREAFINYEQSLNLTFYQRSQNAAFAFYEHRITQMSIAGLLMINFVINIIQTETENVGEGARSTNSPGHAHTLSVSQCEIMYYV